MGENGEKYTPSGIIYYEASCIASLPDRPAIWRVSVPMMAIGKVVLIGFPGEPFTSYMHTMRKQAPDKFLLCLMQANGGVGYFPDKQAYEQGTYEVVTSPFDSEIEDKLLATTDKMLNGF